MKKKVILLAILVSLILVVSVSADKVDYKVEEKLEGSEEVSVVVMLNDASINKQHLQNENLNSFQIKKFQIKENQDEVLSTLHLGNKEKKELLLDKKIDFKLKHRYTLTNDFAGEITKEGLEKLKSNPNVERIVLDKPLHIFLDVSVPQINATSVWAIKINNTNITGRGETICIVDSGVDYNHTNLGGGWGNKVSGGYNAISDQECSINNSACFDDHGHGTHVAGIIISNHTTYKGVAPDAKIIAIKACDSSGTCQDSDVKAGMEWCINNATRFNISVISMSLGSETTVYNDTYCNSDSLASTINTAVGNNISVVVAAGNTQGSNGIASPACVQNATPVGAVDDNDYIYYDRGVILDLLAPGVNIKSLKATGTTMAGCSDEDVFRTCSGTSMATPHVSGAITLLLQFKKLENGSTLTVDELKIVFNSTGKTISDSSSNLNFSRIDVLAAIRSLDTIAPIWSNNATNNSAPKKNNVVQFNVTWNDTIGLSFYFFSWNDTGSWVNISNGTLSGTLQSISVNQTVTAVRGKNVYWKFYTNDTNNNWNMTDEWSFTVQNTAPTTPNVTFPVNNTNYADIPYINYSSTDADGDAITYKIYINGTLNVTLTTNLTDWNASDGFYNLTVTANDSTDSSSNSTVVNFGLDSTGPSFSNNQTNATAITPKYNDVVQVNLTLTDNLAGLDGYFFAHNDTGTMTNGSYRDISGTSHTVIENITIYNLKRGGVFGWKVWVNDSVGNINESNIYILIIANTIPTVANLTLNSSDSLNRTNGSLVAHFDYSDIDNDANTLNETRWYNSSQYVSNLDNLTSLSPTNLSHNQTWVFSVRLYDGYNWSIWYNSSNITVINNVPNTPTLNSPGDNSIVRVNYTLLNWTAGDDDGNPMTCYAYGGNTSNPTSLINITSNIANGSSPTYNWSNLNETTYYWKVQCDDGISNSSNSSVRQFTVAIVPTTHPTLVSVADYDLDGNIEINWSDDGNETGESYRIYRFTSNITLINSSVINTTAGISNGTQFFEDNTTANGTAYWYVLVTVDAEGNYNASVFSNCLNGMANDTIKPKIPRVVNVTSSSGITTINWTAVMQDINGNPDNFSLSYKMWYRLASSANLSKALVNETADLIERVSASSVCSGDYCKRTHTLSSTSLYYYFVTTIDDGGNENLTLDNSSNGNYGNVTVTNAPSTSSSNGGGGGGGSGGGGGGGGGGGTPKTINLDIKPEFKGSGYTAKQTQGDEAKFTLNNEVYDITVAKLKSDSVTINVGGASSVFKEEDVKEFDVDGDGSKDVSITLKKIEGGRAEITYKMLSRAEEEKVEEKEVEEKKVAEELKVEEIKEEKPRWVKLFFIIAIAALVFLIVSYIVLHKYVKNHPS